MSLQGKRNWIPACAGETDKRGRMSLQAGRVKPSPYSQRDEMSQGAMQIIMYAMGLLVMIYGWLFKELWSGMKAGRKETEQVKLNCEHCKQMTLEAALERFEKILEERLDAWWNRIELRLINENRLPSRGQRKNQDQNQ